MAAASGFHGPGMALGIIFVVECSRIPHISDCPRDPGSPARPWRLTAVHLSISREGRDFRSPSVNQSLEAAATHCCENPPPLPRFPSPLCFRAPGLPTLVCNSLPPLPLLAGHFAAFSVPTLFHGDWAFSQRIYQICGFCKN